MINFKNIKRHDEYTYTMINAFEQFDIRFALKYYGEEDYKFIRKFDKLSEKVQVEMKEKLGGQPAKLFTFLESHFDPDEFLKAVEDIEFDQDIIAAKEEEEFFELEKKWNSWYEYEELEGENASDRMNINYQSSDFFQKDEAEKECKLLILDNIEKIANWMADANRTEPIRFRKIMGEVGNVQKILVHGDTKFVKYYDMYSFIKLEKDKESEVGFTVSELYIENDEYVKKFNINDIEAPVKKVKRYTQEEKDEIKEFGAKLRKSITDGTLLKNLGL